MNSYSVIYNDINDPSEKEVNELIEKFNLNNIQVQDKMPGIILVTGQLIDLLASLEKNSNWSASPVAQLSHGTPKHKF